MRASTSIVRGRFCGGEIEPGTFHVEGERSFTDGSDRDTTVSRTVLFDPSVGSVAVQPPAA